MATEQAPRTPSAVSHEAMLAALATAGIRMLLQDTVSATNGANTPYTVAAKTTRRVMVLHLSSGNGDIRFNVNAAATATSFPLLAATCFVLDVAPGGTVNFWNTTASPITVYVIEMS